MRQKDGHNPPWWLSNKHIQSCISAVFPYRTKHKLRWEELTLPDGDFLDLVWAGEPDRPTVLLLHGIEGSVYSHYIQTMIDYIVDHGWQAVVMHYRSCSGRINRMPFQYNALDTRDLEYVINVILDRNPNQPLYAVGYSLGGNLLVHYLADFGSNALVKAVAVSTPYELSKSADYLAPFYHHFILRSLRRKAIEKLAQGIDMPFEKADLNRIHSIRGFDRICTAPLAGYRSVDQYYQDASARYQLPRIQSSFLILHALDDPFVPCSSLPRERELSASTVLEVTPKGGHLGFWSASVPWRPNRWIEERIMQFFSDETV